MTAWLREAARKPAAPILVTAMALSVVWAASSFGGAVDARSAEKRPPAAAGVVLAQSMERVSSESLTDWVNVADHVVAVTVIGEERVQPGISETAPAGEGMVERKVTFQVNEVLWSSPRAFRKAPAVTTVPSGPGWIRRSDGTESKAARAGSSRLEVGNDYTLGLVWKPAQCYEDVRIPARWALVGSGAILPADAGVIGVGEFEGAKPVAASQGAVGPPIAQQFAGKGLASLREALAKTAATDRVEFVSADELCTS